MTQATTQAPVRQVSYATLGEPIPKNTALLRTSAEYRQFPSIYLAQKQLNKLIQDANLDADVRLIMIDRTSDIPRKLWEVFPPLIDPIRNHHQVNPHSTPETVLISLANCLVKGMFPFPRVISIPEDYRSVHLYPASDEFPLTNPLPEIFQQHAAWFEQGYDELTLTADESESGRYQASTVDALVEVAKDAVEQSPQAYAETLSAQNP